MEDGQLVLSRVIRKIQNLSESDKIFRKVALSIHTLLEERIFQPATRDKNNTPVGTKGGQYSEPYKILRQRAGYGGRDATNIELSGVLKSGKVGKGGRAAYVTSGQMRSDFKVRPATTSKGQPTWGHGFSNQFNYDKSLWVEKTYKAKIFSPTEEEAEKAREMFMRLADEVLR